MGIQDTDLCNLEELISRLRGVEAVKIIAEDGDITEVHVLARGGRGPKQIVRDIESLCAARLGLTLDHKKISVAQLSDGEKGGDTTRLRIVKTEVTTGEDKLEIAVSLAHSDQVHQARVQGGRSGSNRIRLMVEAGLKCASLFLVDSSLALDHIRNIRMNERSAVLVSVILTTPQGEQVLLGSSFAQLDPAEAALRAALDAVNRRIAVLMD